MDPVWSIGAIAALITAIVGAVVALSRRKPDVAKVYIEASSELVVTQSTVLRDTTAAYNKLQERVELMESNYRAQEERHRRTATELGKVHRELEVMHEQMAQLTESRDDANRELEVERRHRQRLQTRVDLLEQTLRQHNIPIPNGEYEQEGN